MLSPIFTNFPGIGGKSNADAMGVRQYFTEYFTSAAGALRWQVDTINSGIL